MADSPNGSTSTAKNIATDLSSGVVVFLVALPLCLGIALASNAPLFSGILAGIVGGLIVGALSGSHTSVSGPAAGLTAVVIAQIESLGSFDAFVLAVFFGGVLQIVMGVLRAGVISDFVPTSVIKGLLAAIGLILILKQIPHLVGHDSDPEGEMSFVQPDQETTFSELLETVSDFHPGAALVGITSLVFLLGWNRSKKLSQSPIPGPLVVVLYGVGLHFFLETLGGRWLIGQGHRVNVPVAEDLETFLGFLQMPDWSQLTNPALVPASITIAAVASLETLLNLQAVDKLDPLRRYSPPNRELVAQGCGNVVCGLIGGLPVTSVIIRSSVNVNTGAKTKLSAIFHGFLLLLCVGFFPTWLNEIPLAGLAAVLIVTGLKLASPQVFRSQWKGGHNQFLPFVITIIAILLTDLLIGILIGLAVGIFFVIRGTLKRPLRRIVEKHVGGDVLRIELANQVSFLNRVALTRALNQVPRDGHLLIDARNTDYIDNDVLNLIREYEQETAPARGVHVSLLGFQERYGPLEDRVQYADFATRELQNELTPAQVLDILKQGNERFRTGQRLTRDYGRLRTVTAENQHPLATVLAGTSSRLPIETIFDLAVGDLLCTRATGNHVGDGVLGSLEYGTAIYGAKLLVVLGHTKNNLVRMAARLKAENSEDHLPNCPYLSPIVACIQESISPGDLEGWHDLTDVQREAVVDEISRRHVLRSIGQIIEASPALRELDESGELEVVGGMYDVYTGAVTFLMDADKK